MEEEIKGPIHKISLHYSQVLNFWSFDLSNSPKDFQKCFNVSFCLAIECLRSVIPLNEAFRPRTYLQFKYYETNGQIVLDIKHQPFCTTISPLSDWLEEFQAPDQPVIMKLGPKWYLFKLICSPTDHSAISFTSDYDYELIIRSRYPGEEQIPLERDYSIIDYDGSIID